MRVVVTEVTNMSGTMHCVAACDVSTGAMIRPKPDGRNWTNEQIRHLGVKPNIILNLGANTRRQNESYLPHRNEDVALPYVEIQAEGEMELENPTFQSVRDCFGNNVQLGNGYQGYYKAYVNDGVDCPSLNGVLVLSQTFYLFFNTYKGRSQLRAKFKDSNDDGWDLGVTSTSLNQLIGSDNRQLQAYNRKLRQSRNLHLRVGLARRFPAQHNRCFVQLNGIIV